jgi:hypothetical protein
MNKTKKIIISIVVLVAILVAAGFFLQQRNRQMSPPGKASLSSGDLMVEVEYSRPSVRGRKIFGSEREEALLPYGKYWRLGANEATQIKFSTDVLFNGAPVKKGVYRIYAIPGPETFDIALNSELGKWGYSEPDYSKDILKTKVPVEKTEAPVELYTIRLEETTAGIDVIFEWADTRFRVPVTRP